jgi:gamma-glutamyltranspeptidase
MVTQLCFLYLGFKFTPDSISANNVVQTWHRIIEAVKFGYAYRPFLGDPDFHQEVEVVGNVHISWILAKTAVSAFLIITFAKASRL